jgi:hypothetical protein
VAGAVNIGFRRAQPITTIASLDQAVVSPMISRKAVFAFKCPPKRSRGIIVANWTMVLLVLRKFSVAV